MLEKAKQEAEASEKAKAGAITEKVANSTVTSGKVTKV